MKRWHWLPQAGQLVFVAVATASCGAGGPADPGEEDALAEARAALMSATEQKKLVASDATALDAFGWDVAFDGDTALLGANNADAGAVLGAGAVYVLVRDAGGAWSEQAKLTASDAAPNDRFGWSVALEGDTAVIGAYQALVNGLEKAGAVYVFARSGNAWSQQAKLTASDGAAIDRFGRSVALEGDTLVAGADHVDIDANDDAGAAYVFVKSGNAWSEQAKLTAADVAVSDNFGHSVAISGDTVLVGQEAPSAGTVDVFLRTGDVWSPQAQLQAGDPSLQDRFGFSLALEGDTAVIGAIRADPGDVTDAGAAYVLVRSGVDWTEQAKLVASDGAANDLFGWSVALEGDVALIGAQSGGAADSGVAYAFSRSGDVWAEQIAIVSGDAAKVDGFGTSIALQGTTAIFTAPGADPGGLNAAGAAYVFEVTQLPALDNGAPCTKAVDCNSLHCVDGVCCDTACDGGPCDGCSVLEGALVDGVCALFTGAVCDDGDACTLADTCDSGACVGTDSMECPGGDECHDASVCDPATGLCSLAEKPDGTSCDDGDLCTLNDACTAGSCAGDAVVCKALNDCHEVGSCSPATGECSNPVKIDGAVCSVGECENGECVPDTTGTGGTSGTGIFGGSATTSLPPDDGDCGCEAPGTSPRGTLGWLLSALGAAALVRRRRSSA